LRFVRKTRIRSRKGPRSGTAAWTLLELLSSPSIASKAWAYRQYDSTVRTNTVIGPGGDAAVLRLRGTSKAISVKVDGNGRYVYLDPRGGGRIAVAECARNVACTGARPLAVTNCLNFGNPTRPAVYFQLREAIRGMGEACSALSTPVTGGNVSLYNESSSGAVFPTPVIGMVGLIDDVTHVTRSTFAREGDTIVLLGRFTRELGASEYLSRVHGLTIGAPPACDLDGERALVDALLDSIRSGVVASAHDCSDGGFAVALAECCVANRDHPFGAEVTLDATGDIPLRALLFGEAQGRVIVSSNAPAKVLEVARTHGVEAQALGKVLGPNDSLTIETENGALSISLKEMISAYHEAIPKLMSRAPSDGVLIDHLAVGAV
jgi:Phosphoribosylformylglycinamidine (FGAM) synthase, synthetase domain